MSVYCPKCVSYHKPCETSDLVCQFCGEGGFDLPGLWSHYHEYGGCDDFRAVGSRAAGGQR